MKTASGIWGGEGFIVAAYGEDGSIPESVVHLVAEYDPDHLVVMKPTLGDYASIEQVDLRSLLDPEVDWTEDSLALAVDMDMDVRPAMRAADSLARRLSLMAVTDGAMDLLSGHGIVRVRPGGGAGPLRSAGTPRAALAVDAAWTDELALWAAVEVGVDTAGDSNAGPRAAPSRDVLLRWLLAHRSGTAPDELLVQLGFEHGILADGQPTWFRAADPSLSSIGSGRGSTFGSLVVGDTAADFCMAVAHRRMLRRSLWIPLSVLKTLDGALRLELENYISNAGRSGEMTFLSSASITTLEISNALRDLSPTMFPNPANEDDEWRGEPTSYGNPPLDQYRFGLYLGTMIDSPVTIPAQTSADGSIALLGPMTLPVPATLWAGAEDTERPYWYVDVDIDGRLSPSGHGLSPRHVLEPQGQSPVMIRSSRDGVSLHSVHYGFIAAQSLMVSRMARPRLAFPSMTRWVKAMAGDASFTTKFSAAGLNTNLIAERLGGRQSFFGLSRHPAFEALAKFARLDRPGRTDQVFPTGGGTVVERTPYLSMAGLMDEGRVPMETVSNLLDRLTQARLVRRGLVLRCAECAQVSFIGVDDLGGKYSCPQCGHRNVLTSERWNGPSQEPTWFFDLHSRFREWIAKNGIVPLLAARTLAERSRAYDDAAEIEFTASGKLRPSMEIDLIARIDNKVAIVEAKAAGTLGSGQKRAQSIEKLLDAAELLHADVLYLATTRDAWPAAEVEQVRAHAGRRSDLGQLVIEVLTV